LMSLGRAASSAATTSVSIILGSARAVP